MSAIATIDKSKINSTLKDFFGFDRFKDRQEEIIFSILNGNDTFVLMPTGGGKSLCYQLPALVSEGTAIIISPLIALMKNQVDQMRMFSKNERIAHFLNSSLNKSQTREVKEDIANGLTKILYVAPETLTKEENIDFFKSVKISFIAVDEAHCISEWGHDFRPEYRKIRYMADEISTELAIIALTATATPKVKSDIVKNLQMENPMFFISSFNRANLFYEIRPKIDKETASKDIVKFIQNNSGKSGIIYCLNRKTTGEVAELLKVNGIRAAAYHAGLDSKTRSKCQDDFLNENIEVVCATIAFGMGIDKPDVRFVIHFDLPKSLENYYQETGRAGRDGLEGVCVTYYSQKDLYKLYKLLKDKSVSEKEISAQLLFEVESYIEASACRRKFILKYFGEEFDDGNCNKMCDNCKNPKEKVEGQEYVDMTLQCIQELKEHFDLKHIVNVLRGEAHQKVKEYGHDQSIFFGKGKEKDKNFWNSVIRQSILNGLINKDIEDYGLLKISEKGHAFLKKPFPIKIAINHNFEQLSKSMNDDIGHKGVADPVIFNMLKDLRRQVAKEKNLPPFVIFQDPSLEDMAIQYPITIEELEHITGVGRGKAMKFGQDFVGLIADYVEENEIERPNDFIMKSLVNKSGMKVYVIQNIDRKMPLEDIANAKGVTIEEVLHEIESIVSSGTKINLDYYINDMIDEESQDIIFDYFQHAETDDLDEALDEIDNDEIDIEALQLMRIKFMSEVAN